MTRASKKLDADSESKIQHIKLKFKNSFTSPLIEELAVNSHNPESSTLQITPRITKRKPRGLNFSPDNLSTNNTVSKISLNPPLSAIKIRLHSEAKNKKPKNTPIEPVLNESTSAVTPIKIKLSSSFLKKNLDKESSLNPVSNHNSTITDLTLESISNHQDEPESDSTIPLLPLNKDAKENSNFILQKSNLDFNLNKTSVSIQNSSENPSESLKSNQINSEIPNNIILDNNIEADNSKDIQDILKQAALKAIKNDSAKTDLNQTEHIKSKKGTRPRNQKAPTNTTSIRASRKAKITNEIISPTADKTLLSMSPQALIAATPKKLSEKAFNKDLATPNVFDNISSEHPDQSQDLQNVNDLSATTLDLSSNIDSNPIKQCDSNESFEIPDSDLVTELFDSIYHGSIKIACQIITNLVNENIDLNALRPIQFGKSGGSTEFIEKIKYLTSTDDASSTLSQSDITKKKLEKYQANISTKFNPEDEDGLWTPLHAACFYGRTKIISFLLESGNLEIEKKDTLYETTALGWAAYGGHPNSLRRLYVNTDATLLTKNKFGLSPFDLVPNPENPKWADFISGDIESIRLKKMNIESTPLIKKKASTATIQPQLEPKHKKVARSKNLTEDLIQSDISTQLLSLKWDDISPDQKKHLLTQNYPDIQVIVHVFEAILNYNDGKRGNISIDFEELPDSIEYPEYYEVFTHPISLEVIAHKIFNGQYLAFAQFDSDVLRVFHNACFFNVYGSEIYQDAVLMLSIYSDIRLKAVTQFNTKFNLTIADQVPPTGRYATRLICGDHDLAVGDCVLINTENMPLKVAIILRLSVSGDKDSVQLIDGMWFIHPSETNLEQIQSSFPHEVFLNPTLFTGIHSNNVVSKCAVIPYKKYTSFYPKEFDKKDVYVCEYSFVPHLKKLIPLTVWPSPSPLQQPPDHFLNFSRYPEPLTIKRLPLKYWDSDLHLPNKPIVSNVKQDLTFRSSVGSISHNLNLAEFTQNTNCGANPSIPAQQQPRYSNKNTEPVNIKNIDVHQSTSVYNNLGINPLDYNQLRKQSSDSVGALNQTSLGVNVDLQNLQKHPQSYHPSNFLNLNNKTSGSLPYTQINSAPYNSTLAKYSILEQNQQTQPISQPSQRSQYSKAPSTENYTNLNASQTNDDQTVSTITAFTVDPSFNDQVSGGIKILKTYGEKVFTKKLLQTTLGGQLLFPLISTINSGLFCLQIIDSEGASNLKDIDYDLEKNNNKDYFENLQIFQHWDTDTLLDDNHSIQVPNHVSNILIRPIYPLIIDLFNKETQEILKIDEGFANLDYCECSLNLELILPRLLDVKTKLNLPPKEITRTEHNNINSENLDCSDKSVEDNIETQNSETIERQNALLLGDLNQSGKTKVDNSAQTTRTDDNKSSEVDSKGTDFYLKTSNGSDNKLRNIIWRKNMFFSIPLLPGLNIIKLTLTPPVIWKDLFSNIASTKPGNDTKENDSDWDSIQPTTHTIFVTRV
ncbi:hypothetical protein BB561_000749 [Smittium simulii]|uniref:Bromo domain-containing protein n=1 Tax=Smittium simulii TaxID=133385 RepID=A0A2T9YXS7_9FUNG|nr:hypothetical protein BB561_000749 [Smittium simulii]